MAPRLSGQNCKFFKFLLSSNSQKRLRYKENNTKYRSLTRKRRSHVRYWCIERGLLRTDDLARKLSDGYICYNLGWYYEIICNRGKLVIKPGNGLCCMFFVGYFGWQTAAKGGCACGLTVTHQLKHCDYVIHAYSPGEKNKRCQECAGSRAFQLES